MSADDESFHPLGQDWENDLEDMLDDTEYDTDLGMKMAEDAMRVTKGELSEADFHEKYHDEMMDEFGQDDRPTEEAYEEAKKNAGGFAEMLKGLGGDGGDSRRGVMKKMGAGAAMGIGAWGTTQSGEEPSVSAADTGTTETTEEFDTQWGMTIDLERCDGCLSCVQACTSENNLDKGVNWMYVLQYEEDGPDSSRNRLVRPCQHCTDAPCEKVCPTTARHTRDSDGLVLTDYDVCIGCRYCQVACPYGVNYFQWDEPDISTEQIEEDHPDTEGHMMVDERGRWVDSRAPRGVMSKCTFCPSRQDGFAGEEKVGTTACEDACPPDAIQFGDMKRETSDPQRYINNPARGRALVEISESIPSASGLEEDLSGAGSDLQSVLEAAEDLDEELLTVMKAAEIVTENFGEDDADSVQYEQSILDLFDVLESHGLDLDSQEVLVELELASEPGEDEEFEGADEDAAQGALVDYAGSPSSNFKLLEDIGTNPNVVYFGNEPGPNAEQTETPVMYSDIEAERANGESIQLVDNRMDVLEEETVGDFGVSL
ncbi:4Fe-4S ferredoxin N-terminal domain-containing protein [Halostagnicola kamekurae]|uniref:Prokaryotic molybdopterin-containing oxidoreductase family, iron-sulfur binding subunit n=1 Tax=Halostagnicola kamekurae TaxID=619731 RepID=A0A1I6QWF8_9EURY|nr:4Fe-4S ferredoxin N-terminal domain-containing protein [Halostagnicola kamekurae]SFS56745.1 prokaryotic molybdopterin-containing oxidoreductase family, iron-sulfur binding subunit [Halostagnicola kamekurae]